MVPTAAGDSLLSTLAQARRARRLRFAGLILTCIGLGLVALGARRFRQRRQRRAVMTDARGALTAYTECMIGAPLAAAEATTSRLQRIELGLPEAPPRVSPQDAWPARCREDLARAHGALRSYDLLAKDPPLLRLDDVVERAHTETTAIDEAAAGLDAVVAAALAVGLDVSPRRFPPPSPRHAPPPASPLTRALLSPLPVRSRSRPDETAGKVGTLTLSFFEPRDERWACVFSGAAGARLREARCGEVTPGVVSVAREESARAPGFLRTMKGRFDRFELVRLLPDSDPWVTPLTSSMDTVALFGDQLVWVAGQHWHARSVPPGKGELGPLVDLGEVPGASPELESCQTEGALVVRVKTFDPGAGENMAWMAVAAFEGGAWTRTPGRVAVDVGVPMTCRGHEATWTWFQRRVVEQVRCTADRCEIRTSAPIVLPWDAGGPIHTADLAGQVLIVGLGATTGPFLGRSVASVRMRLAPLAAIAEGPDVVLFGDEAHGGATVADAELFVRDGAAIVLLKGDGPLPYRAMQIDGSGSFHAVELAN